MKHVSPIHPIFSGLLNPKSRKLALAITSFLCLTIVCSCAHKPTRLSSIVLDGVFVDWENIPTQSDKTDEASITEFDILSVATQHSDESVFVLLELDRPVNLQGLDGVLNLLLDLDNSSTTGLNQHGMEGVDLIIEFSPRNPEAPTRRGMGVGVRTVANSTNGTKATSLSHADIGFSLAPTFASASVELAISRSIGIPGFEALSKSSSFNLKFVHISKDNILAEETDILSHSLVPSLNDSVRIEPALVLPSKDLNDLRLMSWNVAYGSILKKPTLYARILKAIQPDVILLQELTEPETPNTVQTFLNKQLPREGLHWQVLLSTDTGSIGCGIATLLPIEPVQALERIPYPNRPEWSVRAVGGKVALKNGKQLLVSSVHLKCCGRIGSSEDQTRLLEAGAINERIQRATHETQFDGIIVGGDLNLVGSYAPLDRLATGLDLSQNNLSVLQANRLTGKSNATWANPGERFVPGRLDYLLHSSSSVRARNAFVFNSAELSIQEQSKHNLKADDSSEASDHFPIVVDLYFPQSGD